MVADGPTSSPVGCATAASLSQSESSSVLQDPDSDDSFKFVFIRFVDFIPKKAKVASYSRLTCLLHFVQRENGELVMNI